MVPSSSSSSVAPTSSSVVGGYDLALVKLLVSEGPFVVGSEVEFEVVVRNQGSVRAGLVEVSDSVPVGMSLVASRSAGWVESGSGVVVFSSSAGLLPGESLSIPLVLRLDDVSLGSYVNVAGISGDDGDDEDSTTGVGKNDPVVDQTDRSGLGVDEIPGDEDDSDIAVFTVPPASIGDRVWSDVDGDGVQDPGEPGIPGVLVVLERVVDGKQVEVTSTVTDASGNYLFDDLAPGAYCIKFLLPKDVTASPSGAGSNDAADSDGVAEGDVVRDGVTYQDRKSVV